jgi:hypothetical protein
MPSGSLVALSIVVIIVGVAFASYYQTSAADVTSLHSVVSSMSANPFTTTIFSTETTTTTSTSISTRTVTSYPIPDNVTAVIAPSGQFVSYSINAGAYTSSGSLGSQQTYSITPVYQNELVAVGISLNCPGSTGPSAAAYLYVNGSLVSQANVACGGNSSGQISYVL